MRSTCPAALRGLAAAPVSTAAVAKATSCPLTTDPAVSQMQAVTAGRIAGAGLAICGAILLALLRNARAEPLVPGASTGAVAAMVLGVGAGRGSGRLRCRSHVSACLGTSTALRSLASGLSRVWSDRLTILSPKRGRTSVGTRWQK